MRWSLLFLPLSLSCSDPGSAQASGSVLSERGLVDVAVQFDGPVVRGDNRLFVSVSGAQAKATELLQVDATMAAHAHVAHAASITASDDGFRVSGLDLFMTGRWQLELQLGVGEERDTASLPVDVP